MSCAPKNTHNSMMSEEHSLHSVILNLIHFNNRKNEWIKRKYRHVTENLWNSFVQMKWLSVRLSSYLPPVEVIHDCICDDSLVLKDLGSVSSLSSFVNVMGPLSCRRNTKDMKSSWLNIERCNFCRFMPLCLLVSILTRLGSRNWRNY